MVACGASPAENDPREEPELRLVAPFSLARCHRGCREGSSRGKPVTTASSRSFRGVLVAQREEFEGGSTFGLLLVLGCIEGF